MKNKTRKLITYDNFQLTTIRFYKFFNMAVGLAKTSWILNKIIILQHDECIVGNHLKLYIYTLFFMVGEKIDSINYFIIINLQCFVYEM